MSAKRIEYHQGAIADVKSAVVAPDPKDSYLLALAEASQAEFLVTDRRQGTPLPETAQIHPNYYSRRHDRDPEKS